MRQGVDADQINGTKSGGFGARRCRSGNSINLFNGHLHGQHVLDSFEDGVDTDAVGNKVGRILGVNDAFTEAAADKIRHARYDRRVGLPAGDNFQQAHVAGRIEKMGNQEVFADFRWQ